MNIVFDIFAGPVGELTLAGGRLLLGAAWLWLPIALFFLFWRKWVSYVRAEFIAKMEWVFLEIRLPQEINKSPAAMELVLNVFQQGFGEGNALEKYWQGGVRPWSSLELVSIGGAVKFVMRVHKGSRGIIESQLYAQYPEVEVYEIEDYTQEVHFDEEKIKLWGTELQLTKPDPYPLKTYIDYGLDKDPKEEFKIDPLAQMIEWLGSLTPGEQAWIQILIRQHKKEDPKRWFGGLFRRLFEFDKGKVEFLPDEDRWKKDVKGEIDKIVKDRKLKSADPEKEGPIKFTKVEEDTIAALERSVTKPAFDAGIRGIYLAEADKFNPANIGGLLGSFKQYSTDNLNGFKPNSRFGTGFAAAYRQDPWGTRARKRKQAILDAYKRRSYFHPPYARPWFILNTEELATIYHFPGSTLATPSFKRLDSRKAEPPAGLPV